MTSPKPKSSNKAKVRCAWAGDDAQYIAYHDAEWGVPVYDDQRLFEFLVLEGAQAGLSWLTILRKREAYRKAFANFDPEKVARYGKRDFARLMKNEGIIRSNGKINVPDIFCVEAGIKRSILQVLRRQLHIHSL